MSPLPSPVPRRRPRRPRRPSRGRNRPPKRVISTLIIVTAVWSIATGIYFAFSDDVLTRLVGHQTKMQTSGLFLDQKQVEDQFTSLLQRQATLEQLFTSGTIKPERIAPPEPMPAEKPTTVSPTEREASLQSPELRGSATKMHRRIHRAASLKHPVGAPLSAAASIASPEPPAEKSDAGIANQ